MRNDFRGIGRAEEIGLNTPIHKAAVLVEFSGFAPVIKNLFNAGRQRTDLCILKVKLRVDGGQAFIPGFLVNLVQRVVIAPGCLKRHEIIDVAFLRYERDQVIKLIAIV